MSKRAKRWLVIAALLIAAGLILFAAVMTAYHWDFSRLSTDHFETNTYEIKEAFGNIQLNTETADIHLAVSDDDMCKVICYEKESAKHSVSVRNDTLTVRVADGKKWYEQIGFGFQSPQITVYLPQTAYASIAVKASTGDIYIRNLSVGALDLSLSTGDITVSDITCTGDIQVSTTTGEVHLTNAACRNFVSTGTTGDISLTNVITAEMLSVERSTGDVTFDRSDAAEIFTKTSTGNVTGSLLTEKVFITKTSTGTVSVPKTTAGGKCEIITSTGDIKIELPDRVAV